MIGGLAKSQKLHIKTDEHLRKFPINADYWSNVAIWSCLGIVRTLLTSRIQNARVSIVYASQKQLSLPMSSL